MTYYGDIHLGDTIDFAFTTTSASTGAPTTLSGVPVLSAYVGSSTTEITAGITLTVDFDTRTGYNHVTIVASSGNGYAASTNVDVVITTGTVGGTSAVGYVVGSFSIDNRGVNVARWLGTAVTAATAGIPDVNTKNINNVAAATPGASGGVLIAGSNAATTFATLTSTGVFTVNGTSDVAQTGDSFARIGATGSGLTSLAASATALSTVQWSNTRAGNLDNVDAAISTRMATYTQPTGFLAATFPLSVASPTNITAGTITTVSGNVNGSVASVTARVTANTDQLAGQTVTAAAGVTFPSSVASPTNITAGTITTVSGNVNGSVASVTNGVTLAANAVDSTAVATSGAQEIAAATVAASLGASNNNYTLGQGLTIVLSAVAGKVSGEDVGAPAFRDLADTKDVITGTDSGTGSRLTITYNP